MIRIKCEFSGGLETLFDNKREFELTVEEGSDIKWLIDFLVAHRVTSPRHDLFVQDGYVRPGVLVLVNDADWELVDQEKYLLMSGDTIHFASTLHGG